MCILELVLASTAEGMAVRSEAVGGAARRGHTAGGDAGTGSETESELLFMGRYGCIALFGCVTTITAVEE
jgi:hypothetical protein